MTIDRSNSNPSAGDPIEVRAEVRAEVRPEVRAEVRVAVMRHEVDALGAAVDGDHIDLMVGAPMADGRAGGGAKSDPNARTVRTWRLPLAVWTAQGLACGRFAAVVLEAHRALYLELAEPRVLSDGRGRVVPLARGMGVASGGGGDHAANNATNQSNTSNPSTTTIRAFGRLIAITKFGDGTVAEITQDHP
jgi:hypothetical protein